MLGGKSPGVTILWLWTIGTAAVLVMNVARTRLKDMEDLVKLEQQREAAAAAAVESSMEADQS